jgi:small subunit ribosomal protein S9
VFFDDAFHS